MFRSSSSLLANSCKAASLLVNHSIEMQENVWNFANNFDITHKIWIELNQFKKDDYQLKKNSLLNAIYEDKCKKNEDSIDILFQNGLDLFDKHYNESIKFLNFIKSKNNTNDKAVCTLESILNLMKLNLDLIIK